MATTASAWTKPGAWALDSEEQEATELIQQEKEKEKEQSNNNGNLYQLHHLRKEEQQQPLVADFPSLSTAVATKSKKKKAVPLSLSQFTTGISVSHGSAKPAQSTTIPAKGLTADELRVLPTGPRERTAEELERSSTRLGGGFRSYGNNSRYSNGGDDSSSNRDRWGSDESRGRGGSGGGGFNRENSRESGPSRADETDDWGAAKKSAAPSFERRERGGGFFDSQSRADESDSWVSNKSRVASSMPPRRGGGGGGGFENPRERRGGFEFQKESNGGGADSDTWGKKREDGPPRERRGGFEFQKESNGGGADSDTWGKKREEGPPAVTGARPRLVLQPRTVSPSNGEQQEQPGSGSAGSTTKSKGSNPFGEARPREEVLAEKGQDWKKIDEQLEAVKIKETDGLSSFGKKSIGNGNGRVASPESRTERSWRKPESVDVPPPASAEVVAEVAAEDDGGVAES